MAEPCDDCIDSSLLSADYFDFYDPDTNSALTTVSQLTNVPGIYLKYNISNGNTVDLSFTTSNTNLWDKIYARLGYNSGSCTDLTSSTNSYGYSCSWYENYYLNNGINHCTTLSYHEEPLIATRDCCFCGGGLTIDSSMSGEYAEIVAHVRNYDDLEAYT